VPASPPRAERSERVKPVAAQSGDPVGGDETSGVGIESMVHNGLLCLYIKLLDLESTVEMS